jgi:hypothetical protein
MPHDSRRRFDLTTSLGAPARITGHRSFDPARLPADELERLCEEVYAVYDQVFVGVGKEELRRSVILPEGEDTVVRVYTDAENRVVGFAAFNCSTQIIDGKRMFVMRDAAAILPAYRGQRVTYWYGFTRALVELVRHPFTPVCFLGVMVHPSSYHLMYRYYPQFYPHPDHGFPEPMQALARRLVSHFPGSRVETDRALLRDTGWVTRETVDEGPVPSRYDTDDVRYFERLNPGWHTGHGLVIVVPITLRGLLTAFVRRVRESL